MTIAGKANRMIGLGWLWRLGTDRLAGELAALQRRVEELQAAERRYRDIIDALPVMMVYSVEPTPPHRAFFLSRGHETLGYSREEWMDPSALWLRVLHPDDREWVTRETELALARHSVSKIEKTSNVSHSLAKGTDSRSIPS